MYEAAEELGDSTASDKIEEIGALDPNGDQFGLWTEIEQSDSSQQVYPVVNELIPLTSESFEYAEEFRNGYAFAIRGTDCGYIDRNGVFTVYYQRGRYVTDGTLTGDPEYHAGSVIFSERTFNRSDHMQMWVSEEGLFPMYDETLDRWGYGDIHTGEMVIQPIYLDARPFSEGVALANGENTLLGVDTNGNELFRFENAVALDLAFQDGSALISVMSPDEELNGIYLIDRMGNTLFKTHHGGLGTAYNMHGTGWGFTGVGTLRNDPDHLFIWSSRDRIAAYLNQEGEIVATVPDTAGTYFAWAEGTTVAFYGENGKYGILNESGIVVNPRYVGVSNFANGYAAVTDDNISWYLIDEKGNRVWENDYEMILSPYDLNYIAVKQNGSWGYLNINEETVIPCEYSEVFSRFKDGIIGVKIHGETDWQYINTQGQVISGDLSFTSAFTSEEEMVLICDETGWRHLKISD